LSDKSQSLQKLIAGALTSLLLSLIGLCLFLIGHFFTPANEFRFDDPYGYVKFFFFSLLICAVYSFIFVVLFYKVFVRVYIKAIATSIAGTIVIYLFSAIGGGFDLRDFETILLLSVIAFMGFVLPFLYIKVYRLATRKV